MTKMTTIPENYNKIRAGIVELLKTARSSAARNVNIHHDRRVLGDRTANRPVGASWREARRVWRRLLIKQLANDLSAQFGRGFGAAQSQPKCGDSTWLGRTERFCRHCLKNLQHPYRSMRYNDNSSSVPVLASQFPLPWSAYVRLLSVKSPEARTFYETEALRFGWSVRQLDRQIGSQFYERIALSQNKAAMLEKAENSEPSDLVTPEEAIKDPFVLEFLDLKDEYSESDLEEALIHHLTDFLLELGDDFAFLGRQRRLRIDDTWFRIDLIFFHRRLRALVIVDLKVGKFSYADAGQMHLYLNYASEHWMKPGENPPVGLILCAEKGAAEAHYALDNLPNKVLAAEYQTVLPDEKLIAEELERSRRELEKRLSIKVR